MNQKKTCPACETQVIIEVKYCANCGYHFTQIDTVSVNDDILLQRSINEKFSELIERLEELKKIKLFLLDSNTANHGGQQINMEELQLGDVVVHKIPLNGTPNVKMTIRSYIKFKGRRITYTNKKTDFVYCMYYHVPDKSFVLVAFNVKELKKSE